MEVVRLLPPWRWRVSIEDGWLVLNLWGRGAWRWHRAYRITQSASWAIAAAPALIGAAIGFWLLR